MSDRTDVSDLLWPEDNEPQSRVERESAPVPATPRRDRLRALMRKPELPLAFLGSGLLLLGASVVLRLLGVE